MTGFAPSLDGLTAGQLDDVVRHLRTTYDLVYGCLERQEQTVFRVGIEETLRTEPPAVFLRELTRQVRSGGPVNVKISLRKPDQYRLAELLRQSHARAVREASGPYGTEAASALATMVRTWDSDRRLSTDELERAEWVALPGTPASAAEVRSGVIG